MGDDDVEDVEDQGYDDPTKLRNVSLVIDFHYDTDKVKQQKKEQLVYRLALGRSALLPDTHSHKEAHIHQCSHMHPQSRSVITVAIALSLLSRLTCRWLDLESWTPSQLENHMHASVVDIHLPKCDKDWQKLGFSEPYPTVTGGDERMRAHHEHILRFYAMLECERAREKVPSELACYPSLVEAFDKAIKQ